MIPLLRRAAHGAVVVNNTSIASVAATPMQGIYTASKTAASMLTDILRLELKPFNMRVVDLKTGSVRSNFFENKAGGGSPSLPRDSMYNVAKADVERVMTGDQMAVVGADRHVWAQGVATDVLAKSPPRHVWRGTEARLAWFVSAFMPYWFVDSMLWKHGALDIVDKKVRAE